MVVCPVATHVLDFNNELLNNLPKTSDMNVWAKIALRVIRDRKADVQ
jgi:hypothetical protein